MHNTKNHKFSLTPHKKIKRSEGISQEKNGRDPLGGTNFFLDLFRNEVKKLFGGGKGKNDCRNLIRSFHKKNTV